MSRIDQVAESLVAHLRHPSMDGVGVEECTEVARDVLIQNAFAGGLIEELAAKLSDRVRSLAAELAKRDATITPHGPGA